MFAAIVVVVTGLVTAELGGGCGFLLPEANNAAYDRGPALLGRAAGITGAGIFVFAGGALGFGTVAGSVVGRLTSY